MRSGQRSGPEDGTVDHFIPKSYDPEQAYEWSNYRLSRRRMNERKGNHDDVLDPFSLAVGWFKIDFRTFQLLPNSTLSEIERSRIIAAIERLGLNSDNDYVNERIGAIREYCLGYATITQLERKYPFLADEMIDQGFDRYYLPQMRAYFSGTSGS